MNEEQAYPVWAPEGGVWSRWAKPVLFAYLSDTTRLLADSQPEEWGISVPAASPDIGMVIDLDGPRGVFFGMRMARKGYRPVPLYNACPRKNVGASPDAPVRLGLIDAEDLPQRSAPVVEVSSVVSATAGATDELRGIELPEHSPPAFLLDWRRGGIGKQVSAGMFDNRSVIFPSDFPSAAFLKGRGIKTMVVVSETHTPDFDLAAVLREWAAAGLDTRIQIPGPVWSPKPISLPAQSWLRRAQFWVPSHLGLRRNSSGGYGRVTRGNRITRRRMASR
jgi:hypothetical protein